MMEGRFEVGDRVQGKGTGIGVVIGKQQSKQARLVGATAWIYQVNGPGFNIDQWYAESSLVMAN